MRLKNFFKIHRSVMVAVLEPLAAMDRGESLKVCLEFDSFLANDEDTTKIWLFSCASANVEIVLKNSQAMTLAFFDMAIGSKMWMTLCVC